MYNHIKSCVLVNNTYSNFFLSHSVVRQGENLSPLLFSIFINDLESFLDNEGCKGVEISGFSENNVVLFMKLFILLYADDTVLLSENPQDLQASINKFHNYCET